MNHNILRVSAICIVDKRYLNTLILDGDSSSIPSVNHSAEKQTDTLETWPIFVRLSSNGQDITIQVPTHPPYMTVSGLRQKLLPHFEKNAKVKLIYLGRILTDQHSIIPTETDDDTPLPPPKKKLIQIQKEGVIQALITNPN
jgi:hypothetical protein